MMYTTHDAVLAPTPEADVDWTFGGLWPYEPHWFETDEGPRDGWPVVLVHGDPTWGCLYRNFIDPLVAAGYRAIVPDHPGLGCSDKPTRPDVFWISDHVSRLDAPLESLDLAVAHPERVASSSVGRR
jgi:pimeloyl-ACP methyl ester carboxylesterase